jgi:hypothetical protein
VTGDGRPDKIAFFSMTPFVSTLSALLSAGETGKSRPPQSNTEAVLTTGDGKLAITSLSAEFSGNTGAVVTFFNVATSLGMRSTLTTGFVFDFFNDRDELETARPAELPTIRREPGTCFKLALVGGLHADDAFPKPDTEAKVFASSELRTLSVAACSSKVAVTDSTEPCRSTENESPKLI